MVSTSWQELNFVVRTNNLSVSHMVSAHGISLCFLAPSSPIMMELFSPLNRNQNIEGLLFSAVSHLCNGNRFSVSDERRTLAEELRLRRRIKRDPH